MIVLDTTIVNVALPSIKLDLAFSETSLVWVVNAYMVTYGGFLLLGGRLGDLFGHRRLFLTGIALFTGASLGCGLASDQVLLIGARAVQGIGGAVVCAVALSLIMNLFTESGERARAMGVYGFVCAGGGSIGVVLGGFLTSLLSWHWIFLVNLPIGLTVYLFSLKLLPPALPKAQREKIDYFGAASITLALVLAVFAIVNGNENGWSSLTTLGMLGLAALLLVAFLWTEAHVGAPLVPLALLARRNLAVANVAGVLWAAAMFAWFFISALYMQRVLGYSALQVGLSFLPSNLLMAAFSLGISARLVLRFGLRRPLAVGLAMAGCGLTLFARAPIEARFVVDVLPGMLLLGLGAGVALNPMLLAAMTDVAPEDSGLASGIVNTSFMMGGALGLAILASLAAATTQNVTGDAGVSAAANTAALNAGYHVAFGCGATFAFIAALFGATLLRTDDQAASTGDLSSTDRELG